MYFVLFTQYEFLVAAHFLVFGSPSDFGSGCSFLGLWLFLDVSSFSNAGCVRDALTCLCSLCKHSVTLRVIVPTTPAFSAFEPKLNLILFAPMPENILYGLQSLYKEMRQWVIEPLNYRHIYLNQVPGEWDPFIGEYFSIQFCFVWCCCIVEFY